MLKVEETRNIALYGVEMYFDILNRLGLDHDLTGRQTKRPLAVSLS